MIVNWTNEEGSRFAPAMLASGVYAGVFTRDYAYAREDREGKNFGDELERIGYRGAEPVGSAEVRRHVRAPHRAGTDPRGREQDGRHRHRRPGHALVRGHGEGPGGAYRRDAHGSAQQRAARRGPHDRGDTQDRHAITAAAVATSVSSRTGRTAAMSCREKCSSPSIFVIPTMPCSTGWKPVIAPRCRRSPPPSGLSSTRSASGIRPR